MNTLIGFDDREVIAELAIQNLFPLEERDTIPTGEILKIAFHDYAKDLMNKTVNAGIGSHKIKDRHEHSIKLAEEIQSHTAKFILLHQLIEKLETAEGSEIFANILKTLCEVRNHPRPEEFLQAMSTVARTNVANVTSDDRERILPTIPGLMHHLPVASRLPFKTAVLS